MFTVFKKELKVYFNSLLGYTLISVYLLIAGLFFFAYFLMTPQAVGDFSPYFSDMNTTFLLIVPILTIRILAEDRKLGTLELLLTSPISSWEIVMGKFLAVLLFMSLGSAILLVFPIIISFNTHVEWGSVFTGYFGMIFSLSFFVAVGIFSSSLTDNYVVAGLISFVLFIVLFLITLFGNGPNQAVAQIFKEISFSDHYAQFAQGLIRLKDILYFLMGTFIWLFLAKTVIESQTWKS